METINHLPKNEKLTDILDCRQGEERLISTSEKQFMEAVEPAEFERRFAEIIEDGYFWWLPQYQKPYSDEIFGDLAEKLSETSHSLGYAGIFRLLLIGDSQLDSRFFLHKTRYLLENGIYGAESFFHVQNSSLCQKTHSFADPIDSLHLRSVLLAGGSWSLEDQCCVEKKEELEAFCESEKMLCPHTNSHCITKAVRKERFGRSVRTGFDIYLGPIRKKKIRSLENHHRVAMYFKGYLNPYHIDYPKQDKVD